MVMHASFRQLRKRAPIPQTSSNLRTNGPERQANAQESPAKCRGAFPGKEA